jgi:hypothetical protein
MSTSQAGVLDATIKKTFGGVFCDMVGLMLKLRGFANRD